MEAPRRVAELCGENQRCVNLAALTRGLSEASLRPSNPKDLAKFVPLVTSENFVPISEVKTSLPNYSGGLPGFENSRNAEIGQRSLELALTVLLNAPKRPLICLGCLSQYRVRPLAVS
jgi:hypothetical protein